MITYLTLTTFCEIDYRPWESVCIHFTLTVPGWSGIACPGTEIYVD